MSAHNTRRVSKGFKSPFKNEARSAPSLDQDLSEEYEALRRKEASLDQDISVLLGSQTDVKTVMNLLHQFNEIKDATQIVLGKLASAEGETLKQIHERFGLQDKD